MHIYNNLIILSCLMCMYRTEDELVAVTALIRHGTRIPEELYPADPYQNYTWPYAFGDLTNSGVREMYTVGKWIRKNYGSFISREYDVNQIYAQSVDFDRCTMSGEATLAGLYPPLSKDVWNQHIQWQPIPLHTSPVGQDFVLNVNTCPKIPEESALIRTTQFYNDTMTKYQGFFDYISENSGETINFSNMYPLFDTLFGEIGLKLPMPEWVQKSMPLMSELIVQYTKMDSMTLTERQIQVGPLLGRIIEQFHRAINSKHFGTSETIYRKFMAYFTSEWILYDLTYALGLPSIHIPEFGAQYYVELRKNRRGNHYVNLLFRNATAMDTVALPVPLRGSNFDLDYSDFKNFVQPYVIYNSTEWVRLCEEFTGQKVHVDTNVPNS